MAAGLGSASEPWGSSGVCGLPGAAPSAERAVCPSGEQQSGGGLCLFLFYAEFKAQPSPQLLSSPVYLLSIRLGAPRALGDPPAPGLLPAVPGLSILKMMLPLGQPPPSQCFGALCPSSPGPRFVWRKCSTYAISTPHTMGKQFFEIVSLESRKPGIWLAGPGASHSASPRSILPEDFPAHLLISSSRGSGGVHGRLRHPQFVDGDTEAWLILAGLLPRACPRSPTLLC